MYWSIKCIATIAALGLALGASAAADCPGIYNQALYSTYCGGVCYSCNSGEVCCDGGAAGDVFILIEDDDDDPHIYGTVDIDYPSERNFCCNSSDLGSITSAVKATITTGSGSNVVCLQDSNAGSCVNALSGLQVWPAASDITGGNYDDEIRTSATGDHVDEVDAAENADIIHTYYGDDVIDAGAGVDSVRGGEGDDTISGGSGIDTIGGDAGADTIDGGADGDIIGGDSGVDVLSGGGGVDEIHGGQGRDQIVGEDDEDDLFGDAGNDCICGGWTNANDDGHEDEIYGGSDVGGGDTDDCYYVYGEDIIGADCENQNDGAACPCG